MAGQRACCGRWAWLGGGRGLPGPEGPSQAPCIAAGRSELRLEEGTEAGVANGGWRREPRLDTLRDSPREENKSSFS
ncbi:Hypothetical predicted protein [Marmota monax]|uniref:Uncharacterized protein n=1 Tax=Marmota monax TaxID=9995 RepID=A0A5E4B9P5_MARMO|nr:hypothetical protein GHT09_008952 [Marmota monax]VTJ66454.1 Hypothetical predicted protein [Marmota monax]